MSIYPLLFIFALGATFTDIRVSSNVSNNLLPSSTTAEPSESDAVTPTGQSDDPCPDGVHPGDDGIEGSPCHETEEELTSCVTADGNVTASPGACGDEHTKNTSATADSSAVSQQASTPKPKSRKRRVKYPDGRLMKADYDYYMSFVNPIRFTLHAIAIVLLSITVLAFSTAPDSSLSNRFIVALNAFQVASSVFNLVFFILQYSLGLTDKVFVAWVIASNYCIVCCRRIVNTLNLLLCAQRLLAVTSPFKARHSVLKGLQGFTFFGIPALTILFHAYVALMFYAKNLGSGIYVLSYTDIYKENLFTFNCLGYVSKTLFSYVPLVLCLCANLLLVCFLHRHRKSVKTIRSVKDDGRRSAQDRQMTIMILVSTFVFTIFSLPSNLNQMISTFMDDYGTGKKDHYLYSVIKGGVNATQTVGDITNFFSYLLLSNSFRANLFAILCLVVPGQRNVSSSGTAPQKPNGHPQTPKGQA